MTVAAVHWTYSLAPDVIIDACDDEVFLRTPTCQTSMAVTDKLPAIDLLAEGNGHSETEILGRLGRNKDDQGARTDCAALLFSLDRLGFLVRTLNDPVRALVSCIPMRAPPESPPQSPPEGLLRLSPHAVARARDGLVSLEAPGAWARIAVHDSDLLALLHELAAGRSAADLAASAVGHSAGATSAVLALMSWCRLLDRSDTPAWSSHDLLMHSRTRGGYARVQLGKISPECPPPPAPDVSTSELPRIALEPPSIERLRREDPPHALVSERRRSVRRQGSRALSCNQLSEFLFRTLHERGGRRPHPSGGACYPLKPYLAVRRCQGLPSGLFAYDPVRHELVKVAETQPGINNLLADAAARAGVAEPPQILLVLAAEFGRTQRNYGDLSYSLILKEVGAVFQVAMMAAAAMGLATCPLGAGNSLLFSSLAKVDPFSETSVGEMMLGSLEPGAPDVSG